MNLDSACCNLNIRRMNLESARYLVCDSALEFVQHLFKDCDIVSNVIMMIRNRRGLDDHSKLFNDLLSWADMVQLMDFGACVLMLSFKHVNNRMGHLAIQEQKGLRPRRWGKYAAEIRDFHKDCARVWLGKFDTTEEAVWHMIKHAFVARGSLAVLNFH
ncbi:ethylene-responsive transcription factor 1B-like protein [Tanacetum coccineum]